MKFDSDDIGFEDQQDNVEQPSGHLLVHTLDKDVHKVQLSDLSVN